MKASGIKTKTFTDVTPAGLDTQIDAFVITLKEAQLVSLLFATPASGEFSAMLVYTL